MKKIILATTALVLSAGFAMADTVRMGTEGAYPPYNFVNDKGEVDGFEREIGDELCKRADLTCEWVTNEWDSIVANLTSGNYDTIIAGMSISDERKQTIDFSENYLPPALSSYLAPAADADLTGAIAAQTGTIQADYIAKSGATLIEFATLDDTIAAVKSGEADAVFADRDALKPFSEGQDLVWAGENVTLDQGIGIGIRKSDTELKAKFDAAIESMKADGTLNTAIKKWFGDDAATF
jgi:polar amino acid transport system substrate-binding protein